MRNIQRRNTTLTRRDFLKVAGAGAAGMALFGTAGCGRLGQMPEEYLPTGGSRMNVVVVILDTLRKDHVGAYGNDWIQTPNLDALASESLRFTQAYPESMPTICARRAVHTGMRTWPFRDWHFHKGEKVELYGWQPVPEDQTTLAEILRKQGYYNMLVTDTFHKFRAGMNFQRGFDVFDFIRGQQTDHYRPGWMAPAAKIEQALLKGNPPAVRGQLMQYFANTAGWGGAEEEWFAPRVFTRAMECLETASAGGQPFFLVVDSYDPHEPWDAPEEYISLYDDSYDGLEPYTVVYGPSEYLTDRELRRMRARYAAEVTMVDRWLGRFLEKMGSLGLSENTLLIVLSDHGHAFGEHGITGKPAYALWPEVTDIPFLIRHPRGKGAGETSDYWASTHDVAPTILSLLEVQPSSPMEGEDLSVILDGKEPGKRRHFTSGYHDFAWARDEQYVMFARNDGTEAKLYDVREDPEMNNDLAAANSDVVKSMWNDYIIEDAGGSLPTY